MATALKVEGEKYVLLEDVSWEAYEALLRSRADTPKRMTYDRGRLEIMAPMLAHENYGAIISRLVVVYTLERRIPLHTGRSTTFRREDLERGLEPDECFWIQNEARMRSKKEFDPQKDPPPDLAIEVDISSSSLDRMGIYADLGVPEVWRFDGEVFSIHLLDGKEFRAGEAGVALPALTVGVVSRFVAMSDQTGETELLLSFLDWVREESKGDAPAPKPKRKK